MIAGKTVVYTTGTFDMLHINHLKMIEYARSLGDLLIIGVNTDEAAMLKKSRPVIPFEERIALVRALKYPDVVIPKKTEDVSDTIANLHVDVYVVGDDYQGRRDHLKELGCDVCYFPYGDGISSSELKKRLLRE